MKYHERRDEPGRFAKAVFKLETAEGGAAYMSVSRTNALNESRSVVEVDAARFVAICSDVSNETQPWHEDYKFVHAVAGFRHGSTSPVPLANVECHEYTSAAPVYAKRLLVLRKQVGTEETTRCDASMINGITRTKWLLANGVKSFPVECSNRASAELLNKHAGVPGGKVRSVDELLPEVPELGQLKRAETAVDGHERERGRMPAPNAPGAVARRGQGGAAGDRADHER